MSNALTNIATREALQDITTETEIIFLLDRSGSMNTCTLDTIGGYNSFLDRQKQDSSRAYLTTILFDNRYEILHDHVEIHDVNHISDREYFARGTTALLDAIGITISNVSGRQGRSQCTTDFRTMIVIITDGLDNASTNYRIKNIYDIILEQQVKHSWEFIFLGADIDSVKTANSIGISSDKAANFSKDSDGIRSSLNGISQTVTNFRTSGEILQ